MAIGVDLVYIPRLVGKDELAKRILSEAEYAQYIKRTKKAEFLAGRFAAKEAFLKAKGNIIGKQPLKTIEVVTNKDGRPFLQFKGEKYALSISHDGDYAIAVCQINE